MALVDEVTATSLPYYEKDLNDLVFRGDPVIERLKKNGRTYDGGTEIHFPIRHQFVSNGFRWYSGNEVFVLVSGQHLTEMKTGWARFQDNTAIPRAKINENSGKSQIVDILESTKESLTQGTQVKLCRALHARDDDAGGMNSMDDLFVLNGTFMNLIPADLTGRHPTASAATSLWNPQINSADNALDYERFDNMVQDVSEGEDKWWPDIAYTNRFVLGAFKAQFQPQERFQDKELLKAGWKNQMVVSNVPIVQSLYSKGTSRTAADNQLTLLNTKSVFLVYLKEKTISVNKYDLRPHQDAIAFQALGNVQLVCLDRFHQGRFTVLQPSLFNV